MFKKRSVRFGITRHGEPIAKHRLANTVHTGIRFNLYYELWDAAIAAGATLSELARLDEYDNAFLARVVAWNRGHIYIDAHKGDAQAEAMKKKNRKK